MERAYEILTPLIPGDMNGEWTRFRLSGKKGQGPQKQVREVATREGEEVWYGMHDEIPRGTTVLLDPENENVKKLVERGHVVEAGKKDGDAFVIGDGTTEEDLMEQKKAVLVTLLTDAGDAYEGELPPTRMNKKQLVGALCDVHGIAPE